MFDEPVKPDYFTMGNTDSGPYDHNIIKIYRGENMELVQTLEANSVTGNTAYTMYWKELDIQSGDNNKMRVENIPRYAPVNPVSNDAEYDFSTGIPSAFTVTEATYNATEQAASFDKTGTTGSRMTVDASSILTSNFFTVSFDVKFNELSSSNTEYWWGLGNKPDLAQCQIILDYGITIRT